MDPTYQREVAIFDGAMELPPEQRLAYLEQTCGSDPALRRRMEALLQVGDEPHPILDSPAEPVASGLASASPVPFETAGQRIGRYKLLQQIGEGGCGLVYMAEQEEPLRRRVALKVIKQGMDTRSVIARFEAERQALALMDHPNIARVLDAGATQTGRPFFVMELVRGMKITEYCDEQKLSTRQRLALFIQVCQAVQHAHQKGIIHRDLKPSNILVTVNDGVAVPKVIDFGIAKATAGQQLTDKTLFTAFEQFIGTPAYMSPEQAVLTSVDVDTRSDIYSLGVLLYELLTSKTPFDATKLLAAGLDEIRRTIREQEPERPSTRLSTMTGQELSTMAQRRNLEAPKLVHEVRGDLDWIVMKAMEKDRSRRYETANGLAMDVQRYLSNEPVVACPPSSLYRFQKLVRRNRLEFTAATAVLAALLIGLGLSTWLFLKERGARREAVSARRQADENFQTAREAIDRMFTRAADELKGQPRMEQVRRRLLEDALQYYQGFLKQKADDLTVRHGAALAYLRIGDIYVSLGQHDKCLEPSRQGIAMFEALARHRPLSVDEREAIADAYGVMAYAASNLSRPKHEALAFQHKALALREELCRDFPAVSAYLRRNADTHVSLANSFRSGGQPKDAVDHCRQALALFEKYRTDFPADPEDRILLAQIHHWLGASLADLYLFEEAEQEYRKAHSLREQLVAAQPDNVYLKHTLAHLKQYLAKLLMRTGRLKEALSYSQAAGALYAKLLENFPDNGDFRRIAAWGALDLGTILAGLDCLTEAEAAFRRSTAMWEKLVADMPNVAPYADDLASSRYGLGLVLEKAGKSGEATEAFRQALALWEQLVFPTPKTLECERSLGWMLVTCPQREFRDPPRARALAKQALQRAANSEGRWLILGIAQFRTGDLDGAIESLHKSMEIARGGDAQQWLFLAMAHWRKGEHQLAREYYNKAVAWMDQVHPADGSYASFRTEAAGLMEHAN